MAFAAASDFFSMKIPNYVSLALVAGFGLLAPLVGMPLETIGIHVAIGVFALAVCFGLFAGGYIGGGDAKLLASTSLWFGWPLVFTFLIYTTLFGGLLALILVSIRKIPLSESLIQHEFVARLHEDGGPAPYGIAIAASALLVYPTSFWMTALIF
ncbi:MAG: prepilin peptidase [Fimbriimonadaceae bacterium]|nr:prepilin peptidase [Alphaproteobacteria bacterium]